MPRTILLRDEHGQHTVTVGDDGTVASQGSEPIRAVVVGDSTVRICSAPARTAWVAAAGEVRWVFLDGEVYRLEVETPQRKKSGRAHHGSLAAPMPATVIKIHVKPGDGVKRGDTLILLEAMKMELPVRAMADGVVAGVRCSEGELVQPGTPLIDIDETSEDEA